MRIHTIGIRYHFGVNKDAILGGTRRLVRQRKRIRPTLRVICASYTASTD